MDKTGDLTNVKPGEPPVPKPRASSDSTSGRAGDPSISKPPTSKTFMHYRGGRYLIGAAAIVLYVLACLSPVFICRHYAIPGWECLMCGWLVVFGGIVAWLGNVAFVPALILLLCGKFRPARWFALAALAIGSTSFFLRHYESVGNWNTGSSQVPIESYGIGLYAWLGSFLVLTLGAFLLSGLQQKARDAASEIRVLESLECS